MSASLLCHLGPLFPYLFFFLVVLEVLESLTIIVELSICPIISVGFYFMYFDGLSLRL